MIEINIWIFNHYAVSPGYSGGTRHFDLGKELVKKGYRVTIFASSFDYHTRTEKHFLNSKAKVKEEIFDGVRFLWLKTTPYRRNNWRRAVNMLSYTYRAYQAAINLNEKPDYVIGSLVHPFAAALGYVIAKKQKCKFIFEERDLWPQTLIDLGKFSPYNPLVWLLAKLEHFLYKKADKIIVLFEKAVDYVASRGIDRSKVIYLPNGVDLTRYDSINQPLPRAIEELLTGPLQYKFIAIYIGAHGLANKLDGLLDTALILKAETPQIHFLFVGDGPEKAGLIKRQEHDGLNNVTFIPPVAKEYIPALLKGSKVGLIAIEDAKLYKWGISMNKIFDYMAAALPIAALCNIENTPIEQSGGGYLAGSPLKLAEVLKRLYADKALMAEMGQKSRNYVIANHYWGELAAKLTAAIEPTVTKAFDQLP